MKIKIDNNSKISSIQEEFNAAFPFLRIEFFSEPSQPGGTSLVKVIKSQGRTLNECRTVHNKNSVSITPDLSVADLDQLFRNNYGLGVQVFRKSGKAWLETTVTEGWTLEEQNRQGEALSL